MKHADNGCMFCEQIRSRRYRCAACAGEGRTMTQMFDDAIAKGHTLQAMHDLLVWTATQGCTGWAQVLDRQYREGYWGIRSNY